MRTLQYTLGGGVARPRQRPVEQFPEVAAAKTQRPLVGLPELYRDLPKQRKLNFGIAEPLMIK